MDNNFGKTQYTRYIELLKKQEILKSEGTSLFYENSEENRELLSYGVILENQIYYNRKAEYSFLIEEYLRENAGEDGARLFISEFFEMFQKDNTAGEILEKEILQEGIPKLANFWIDPKSRKFSDLIDEIVGLCEFLTFNPENSDGMTLDEFRDSIQKIYLEIQNFLNEE